MYNLANLNDVEFENLCKDIMSRRLGTELRRFAPGRDGGIDLTDNVDKKNIIVQVKHYVNSDVSQLISSLKKEIAKVNNLNPARYYICCSQQLSPQRVQDIYIMFSGYMNSDKNIITATEISDFLDKQENRDIVYKHFKLWVESTNVLSNLLSGDIACDSETLLCDIQNLVKLFVKTRAYEEAIRCLEKNNVLIILGDPGTGKSITSKMLVLYYASQGYELKYTTDGADLNALKKSLSSNAASKEVILLDDCFGQAYFSMKNSQETELLSLIKHVKRNNQKILIMNSRVTIYQEAKERTPALIQSFDNREYKTYILDMNKISSIEKAKILYNHLYFRELPAEYWDNVKAENHYLSIVKHQNYNPRIIDFVTWKSTYECINPDEYLQFILNNLNNPQKIWKNEYERRLRDSDRVLLTTLYSLTNTTVSMEAVKECYNTRIASMPQIDLSINQFEQSINRLQNSMIKIIDKKGIRHLAVANPSINDFLREQLDNNGPEKKEIIEKAKSIVQLRRLLSREEYKTEIKKCFESGRVLEYYFEDEEQKRGVIAYFVSLGYAYDERYKDYVQEYMKKPYSFVLQEHTLSKTQVFVGLVSNKTYSFYALDTILGKMEYLRNILLGMYIDDAITCINAIDYLFAGEARNEYLNTISEIIKIHIKDYCDEVPAEEYDIDIGSIVSDVRFLDPEGDVIVEDVIEEIDEQVTSLAYDRINEYLDHLPTDCIIDGEFLDEITVNVYGSDRVYYSYCRFDDDYYDRWREEQLIENADDEIRYMFER